MLFTPESIGVRSSGNLYAAATGIDNARPAREARRDLTKHGSYRAGSEVTSWISATRTARRETDLDSLML